MWALVVVLGGVAIVSLIAGFCLITKLNIAGLIPYLSYFPSLIKGFSFLGLSILSAIGTIYLFLYIEHWGKIYTRWCKNIVNNNKFPSISKHCKISKKLSHNLKIFAMISLVIFLSAFALGYISMCISSSSMEPWHVWNWFC